MQQRLMFHARWCAIVPLVAVHQTMEGAAVPRMFDLTQVFNLLMLRP
ncbi:hypothetical protein [Leptolyngbya sp. CCY15150]|nr:hypothetical protein [Leptolyngbya sp. CCY15150]